MIDTLLWVVIALCVGVAVAAGIVILLLAGLAAVIVRDAIW